MFQKVSVNLNRLRFPASLKSFFSIGYYCMQRKAITNCFIFQVNNIAFHPVHCCLLATVGSDGKFSFWDKDARTKLKVCTHLYFGRLDARPVICFYTPYGIVSFCRSLKFYHTQQDWTWNIKQIFFHEQAYSPYSALYSSFSADEENLLNNHNFLGWWSFPLFFLSQWTIQQHYCKENLDVGHSWGLKGYPVI